MTVLLARYADAAFWMARYMERAENLARILDVTETFTSDEPGDPNWLSVIQINQDEERFFAGNDTADGHKVMTFYAMERSNPTSIASAVAAARENARTLRPLISTEMWSQLNTFHGWLSGLQPSDLRRTGLSRFCGRVKEACQTHTGIIEGTFYRDQGWYFYQLGKYLERADQTTRLVDIKYHSLLPTPQHIGTALDEAGWNAVLRSAAGYHAYRRVHPRGMQPSKVAGFLLFDEEFPRSPVGCMDLMNRLLARLKSRHSLRGGNQALERLDEIEALMEAKTIDDVIGGGLHEFLDFLQNQFIRLSNDLAGDFFGRAEADGGQTQ